MWGGWTDAERGVMVGNSFTWRGVWTGGMGWRDLVVYSGMGEECRCGLQWYNMGRGVMVNLSNMGGGRGLVSCNGATWGGVWC